MKLKNIIIRFFSYVIVFSLIFSNNVFAGKKKAQLELKKEILPKENPIYFKQDPKMDVFIGNLMSKMTIEEKIGQLNLIAGDHFTTGEAKNTNTGQKIREGKVGGIFNIKGVDKIRELQRISVEQSRLKIPLLFGMDVIHGYESTFPIPLGLASSWDMNLIQNSARIAAEEATSDGINWTFSPMVDVARDPRWGRMAEGSGEDPYLGSQIAKAMIFGYQGDDLSEKNTLMACVKHFALYGASEGGRDYNTVDMSKVTMYNIYFPPFKAAIDAGVGSIMASFNEVDGIPATGNRWLQTEVLRNQWNFKGLNVSDYTGISEMIAHGMGDLQEVSTLALKANIDMDMVSEGYLTTLQESLANGKITIEEIDNATKRVLEAKYRLGLFDDPYKYCDSNRAKNEIFSFKNREIAKKAATQSMVLLKNEKQLLPLSPKGKIAVIGPMADNAFNMTGTWSVASKHAQSVTVLNGLKEKYGKKVEFLYAKGANFDYDKEYQNRITTFGKEGFWNDRAPKEMIEEALKVAQNADIILLALGEAAESSGEASSMVNLELRESQKELLRSLKKSGKPIVLLLFNGRAMVINEETELADAVLNVWFPGSEGGNAIAEVLFGEVNPSAKLPITFPRNVGQIPIYYNHKNTGRPLKNPNVWEKFRSAYLDSSNTPLFPFGFGLSYTTFDYSPISANSKNLKGNQTLEASVNVSNSGIYDGYEVVQLYIRDVVGKNTRPLKELKGFEKIFLKSGETKKIVFNISVEDLKYYDHNLEFDWESGDFEIMIGTNSENVQSITVNWSK
jgi:beta-glucosidase